MDTANNKGSSANKSSSTNILPRYTESHNANARREKQAKYLGITLLSAALVNIPICLMVAARVQSWQPWFLLIHGIVLALVVVPRLRSRAQAVSHSNAFIYLTLTWLVSYAALVARSGLWLGMLTAVLGILMATQLLPTHQIRVVVLVVVVCSLLEAGVDLFHPPFQLDQPVLTLVPLAAGFLGIMYYVARIFQTTPQQAFSHRLYLSFLLVGLIPLGITAISASERTRITLTESANRALAWGAEETVRNLDRLFSSQRAVIQAEAGSRPVVQLLAFSPSGTVDDSLKSDVRSILADIVHLDQAYTLSAGLLDLHGNNLVDSSPALEGNDESQRKYFQTVFSPGTPNFVSPVQVYQSLPQIKAVLVFSQLVADENGFPLGVIRVKYDAKILQRLVENANNLAGSGSYAVLFDEYHIQLAHGREPERFLTGISSLTPNQVFTLERTERIPDLPLTAVFGSFPELSTYLDASGRAHPGAISAAQTIKIGEQLQQVSLVYLTEKPWAVAFFRPLSNILAPLAEQNRDFLFVGIISINIVTLLSILLAGSLTRPLSEMTAKVAQVAAGNYIVQADIEAEGELGRWGSAFDAMTDRVQNSIYSSEHRTETQSRALNTLLEISQCLQEIGDSQAILSKTVDRIQVGLGHPFVQIFLCLNRTGTCRLVAASGGLGKNIRAAGLVIKAGSSLVTKCAAENKVFLVRRVGSEKDEDQPQRLPSTRFEICLPIADAGKVYGVLDIQQNRLDGLNEQDVRLLEAIGGQLAQVLKKLMGQKM